MIRTSESRYAKLLMPSPRDRDTVRHNASCLYTRSLPCRRHTTMTWYDTTQAASIREAYPAVATRPRHGTTQRKLPLYAKPTLPSPRDRDTVRHNASCLYTRSLPCRRHTTMRYGTTQRKQPRKAKPTLPSSHDHTTKGQSLSRLPFSQLCVDLGFGYPI